MNVWKIAGGLALTVISVALGIAAFAAGHGMGSDAPVVQWAPMLSTSIVLAVLMVAFEVVMIVSLYFMSHNKFSGRPVGMVVCLGLFGVGSLVAIHSAHVFVSKGLQSMVAPQRQAIDVYAKLKVDLDQKLKQLDWMRMTKIEPPSRQDLANMRSRDRKAAIEQYNLQVANNQRMITEAEADKDRLLAKLAEPSIGAAQTVVQPAPYFALIIALLAWFVNSTGWWAYFGPHRHEAKKPSDDPANDNDAGDGDDGSGNRLEQTETIPEPTSTDDEKMSQIWDKPEKPSVINARRRVTPTKDDHTVPGWINDGLDKEIAQDSYRSLYDSYSAWCERKHWDRVGPKLFGKEIKKLGGRAVKLKDNKTGYWIPGAIGDTEAAEQLAFAA